MKEVLKMGKFYLAYGSNLNRQQMQFRCPSAKAVGTGVIPNYQLLFKGHGGAAYLTIEPARGSCVPVGIWRVDDVAETALDCYEGYPVFYYKKNFLVDATPICPTCGIREALTALGMDEAEQEVIISRIPVSIDD